MSKSSSNSRKEAVKKLRKVKEDPDAQQLFEKLKSGDIPSLSKAITLIESTLEADRKEANTLIRKCLPYSGRSMRLGISGVPGVGKSSFIESFGKVLLERNHKLAVLAIDPSSGHSKGSILGDKTRMEDLSVQENVFIRPSPTSSELGGVARRTREAVILCEAAGFDFIIIETVGVGQSETEVKWMVDFFLLLHLAGAGDELQGIKRGIMEMADAIVITKADGGNEMAAKRAMAELKSALHLFPANENQWIPSVHLSSIVSNTGFQELYEVLQSFQNSTKIHGFFEKNRENQDQNWFKSTLNELVLQNFYSNKNLPDFIEQISKDVKAKIQNPFEAAEKIINQFYPGKKD